MYSIGEISKIVNISIDALRYYDQIGLLKPHHIDEKSRYRQYSKEQVRDLLFILEMKEYGFSLDAIRELLISQNQSRIEGALKNRAQELKVEHERTQKTMQHLHRRLNKIGGEDENTMKKNTVLIVDDAAFMRQMLADILAKNGYTVVGEAATGEEGVDKFIELKPDLVIMDIHMPEGLDGLHATKKIKEIDKDARILICSARGQMANVLTGVQSGAQAFVVKPFFPEQLLDSISDVLEDKWDHRIGLISRWLSDEPILMKLPDEPVGQEIINRLLEICSLDESNSDMELLGLLAEI